MSISPSTSGGSGQYNIETDLLQLKDLGEGNFDKKTIILQSMVQKLETFPTDQTTSSFSNDFGRTLAHLRVTHSQAPSDIGKELRLLSKKMENIAFSHGLQPPRPINTQGAAKLRIAVNMIKKMHSQMVQDGKAENLLREGKVLSTEYWIEFLDKWHRHPVVLDTFFNQWRAYGHCERIDFWSYLNEIEKEGSSVHPELFSEKDQVQYLTAEERKAYRCELKANEKGMIEAVANNGKPLKDGLYITVLGPDNEFYIASKQPGKFQHASFFSGEAVKSAGMFLIRDGVIKNFISQSGHYKPEMPEIFHALSRMENLGFDLSKITLLYGTGGEDKVEISDPSHWQPYVQFKEGKYQLDVVQKEAQPDAFERIKNVTTSDKLVFDFLKNFGGAVVNEDLDVLEPVDSRPIDLAWVRFKNIIAQEIGVITPSVTKESRLWNNTAETVDEILNDAKMMMPSFKKACEEIAKDVGVKMTYGPNDAYAVKGRESLTRKIDTDSEQMGITKEESLKMIGDVLRGTVVVNDPRQIPLVVDKVKNFAMQMGGDVVFKNLWIEERASGYIGVHAKLHLPVVDEKGGKISEKMMIVELQIHLDSIMDGSPECIKEYTHTIYEKVRTGTVDPLRVNPISRVLFASALKPLADKLQMQKT